VLDSVIVRGDHEKVYMVNVAAAQTPARPNDASASPVLGEKGRKSMELAFETVGLRRLCESDTEPRKRLPGTAVDELQDRLADISAAMSASDLIAGEPAFDSRPPGRISFSLEGGYQLVCVGNHPVSPLTDSGLVDFSRVRRLKVVLLTQEPGNG
jgi:hypothetical protein